MIEIFVLLVLFQVKHLVADYYLQFPYMYENKGKKDGWFSPLFSHSVVHGIGTLWIMIPYELIVGTNSFWILILPFFDIITHFVIDRWKATRKGGPDTSQFWTNLGIDQMLHHLVSIGIIYLLVTA